MRAKRAFTLVEMVVVLALVALGTHLAIRELSHVQDARRVRLADRQLEEIRAAVYAAGVRGVDAAGGTGYLADTGSLPPTNDLPLAALWQRPDAVRAFALLPADKTNFVSGLRTRSELFDAQVFVPTGWRGPYLRLPLGRRELSDPWGNPFAAEYPVGVERVTVSNGLAVAVSHYGPAGRGAANRRRISLVPDGGATARVIVYPEANGTNTYGTLTYTWYGPASGLITGAQTTAVFPAPAELKGLTPGPRIFKIGCGAAHALRVVDVRPGDNLIRMAAP